MDPRIARSRLSDEIKEKNRIIRKLPQSEKNKVAVDLYEAVPITSDFRTTFRCGRGC